MKILNFTRIATVVKIVNRTAFDYQVKICYELQENDQLAKNEFEDILTFSEIFNSVDEATKFATSKLVNNIKKQFKL